MEARKKYQPLFPQHFRSWNRRYEAFKKEIAGMDIELENMPKDKGPAPRSKPYGIRDAQSPNMRARRTNYLDHRREAKISAYKRKSLDRQTGAMDTKTRRMIVDRYTFETSRNGFKEYSKKDLKAVKSIPKEDKASFDYMSASYFNKYQLPEKSIAGEKENIDVWSVNYGKMLENYRGRNNPTPGKEKDGPEPGKD